MIKHGFSIDALSGYYGRIFQKIFINQAKEALEKYKSVDAGAETDLQKLIGDAFEAGGML